MNGPRLPRSKLDKPSVNDYPSSDLAVQLISGQMIGVISLQFIRLAVEDAEREVLEQRAIRAANAIEDMI